MWRFCSRPKRRRLADRSQKIPVVLVDDEDKKTFIYQEEGLPSQFYSSPHRPHAVSTTNIEREDIPPVSQDSNSVAEARSMFGESQSASASMSANMHRIVEGVERLVESDTYENAPSVPDQFAFLNDAGEMSTPPAHITSTFSEEPSQPLGTPLPPPPGLGPPVADSLRVQSSQSYTPRPALPSIPSIWNTESSTTLGDAVPPRTPPGLGQQGPVHPMVAGNGKAPARPSSQEHMPDDLRQNLSGQTQFSNSLDASQSPWFPSSNMSNTRPCPAASGWEHESLNRTTFGAFDVPSQPLSSGLAHASWANDAFIASSMSSGPGPYSGHRKSGTHLSAIGQSPPCGQGG